MKKLLLLLMMTIRLAHAQTDGEYDLYHKWIGLGSGRLMEMGYHYQTAQQTDPNKAMLCYTIVLNRYDKAMTDKDKRQCAQAFNNAGFLYFYQYCDYAKAYGCFSKAASISEETGDSLTLMNACQCLANVFMTFAEQNDDKRIREKGLELYRRSFGIALAINDYDGAISNFINMTGVAFSNDCLDVIADEIGIFSRIEFPAGTRLAPYATYIYKSMKAVMDKDYASAITCFDRQIEEATRCQTQSRKRLMTNSLFNKSTTYSMMGDYTNAIAELKKVERIAQGYELRDQRVEVYKCLSNLYLGVDSICAAIYRNNYLELRDTLQKENKLQEVAGLHFLDEFQKIDEEMQLMAEKRETERTAMKILAVGIVALAVFLAILFHKNSQLNKSNRELYRKNKDLLRLEEENRQQRMKYSGSTLTDDAKEQLLTRIREVFDNAETICSEDFSLDRLAALVDSKPKYVSQTINELYGQTFTNTLTEARVKEACRRLNDIANYGHFTIESIAAGVGFKSRANFVTNFKRITGLTPSGYQKIARDNSEQ